MAQSSFKDSLNLPQTAFPMRGNLAKREPARLARWTEDGLYQQIIAARHGEEPFILTDGPPYANGDIHMGHTLNKVLKDLAVRFNTMRGRYAPYVPGWDCHGLPIEQKVLQQVGDKIHEMDPLELRKLCGEYALGWVAKQKEQFQRLGILGDWDDGYTTMTPQYETGILTVLHNLVKKGLVRRGYKAVHWDPVFRTALAEAEIEYHEHESPSIYVAFPLVDASRYPSLAKAGIAEASLVIWTTTPWTMPANLGITLHPEFEYVALETEDGRVFIVAEGLREAFTAACKLENTTVKAKFLATEFERGSAKHPIFPEKESLLMLGEHVTLEQGTGCVHTAPGHGADDFVIGAQYGLPVFCPVDNQGRYTPEYPEMAGTFVFDANPKIVELLKAKGLLLGYKKVKHDYPYSWRSKQPIIFRATEQWFMELAEGGVREKALQAIDNDVNWVPRWGYDRIRSMVERRPEWCISRQRHWGVPIPAVRCISTNQAVLDERVVGKFLDFVKTEGTDAWYARDLADFLPEDWDASDYERTFDILDVWFDSGASHQSVVIQDERLTFPADLYLEGSDQHRGWFQSSLLLAMGSVGVAPFKTVLTHGFILDAEGKAMSKSMGNVISPLDLIKTYGADILRLWVASTDYRNDLKMGDEAMKTTAEFYRTVRNTLRWQLGVLNDFDADAMLVAPADLTPLDRWALHELSTLVDEVTNAFSRYEYHRGMQAIQLFYTITLSARYHDILKDRLYTYRTDHPDRRSAQTVIHHQFDALVRMLAPVLVFTADEAWRHRHGEDEFSGEPVALALWPESDDAWRAPEHAEAMERLFTLRDQVNEELERLRTEKVIGKSIEAAITLHVPEADAVLVATLEQFRDALPEFFIVSMVDIVVNADALPRVEAQAAVGEVCPRCWRVVPALVKVGDELVCPRCAEALA